MTGPILPTSPTPLAPPTAGSTARKPGDPYCANCGYSLVSLTDASRCPECGKPLVEVLARWGGKSLRAKRFRSDAEMFGVPIVCVAFGPRPEFGEVHGRAVGIIAIGDIARGGIAIGGNAIGVVAVGGMAIGVASVGGLSIGALTALGGMTIGGFPVGGFAVGGLAAQPIGNAVRMSDLKPVGIRLGGVLGGAMLLLMIMWLCAATSPDFEVKSPRILPAPT